MLPKIPRSLECNGRLPPLPAPLPPPHPTPAAPHPPRRGRGRVPRSGGWACCRRPPTRSTMTPCGKIPPKSQELCPWLTRSRPSPSCHCCHAGSSQPLLLCAQCYAGWCSVWHSLGRSSPWDRPSYPTCCGVGCSWATLRPLSQRDVFECHARRSILLGRPFLRTSLAVSRGQGCQQRENCAYPA